MKERLWVPRAAHRWQPTTHSARCAAAAAERRTTSALKYSLFTYASSSWQSRHRVDRVAGAEQPASQSRERIRSHPSAGEHGRHGCGSARASPRRLADGCRAHGCDMTDARQMYVRHTAAVGLGLAHLDNIVRHTEEINRPQALNEVLRSLQAREHPLVPKGTASRRLSLAPSVSVSLSLECLGVCGCT